MGTIQILEHYQGPHSLSYLMYACDIFPTLDFL